MATGPIPITASQLASLQNVLTDLSNLLPNVLENPTSSRVSQLNTILNELRSLVLSIDFDANEQSALLSLLENQLPLQAARLT
ncbi:collagen-like repeat preface domain-containing protein [Paenibacillus glycanilyticus]|uniref:collagen-like repeat preface domain-containing protein n=1 Tax=Paenibacillus glycanilyticus TaxID=126569 RepID=UPI0019109CE6|nr:collagen-like repeat preface domain-containing protein [Paenibacillus glycanilyticus]